MKWRILFPFLLVASTTFAQSANINNYISVIVNQPIVFSYLTPDELLHDKVVPNALEVKVSSVQNSASITASIVFDKPGNNDFNNRLALKLNNKTSPNAMTNGAEEIPLSAVASTLFAQPKMAGATPAYSFFYDVVLHPAVTMSPGTSNFSMIFTMTQP